jgi:hypothetical protein
MAAINICNLFNGFPPSKCMQDSVPQEKFMKILQGSGSSPEFTRRGHDSKKIREDKPISAGLLNQAPTSLPHGSQTQAHRAGITRTPKEESGMMDNLPQLCHD